MAGSNLQKDSFMGALKLVAVAPPAAVNEEPDDGVTVRLLRYVLEASGPEEVASRAAIALGLLPDVAQAELTDKDSPNRGDLEAELGVGPIPQVLRVHLADPTNLQSRTRVSALVNLVGTLHAREVEIRRLTDQAHTDPLTGLCNRRGFEPFVDQALGRASRSGEDFALMLCDIDFFKVINDKCGHKRGDMALRAVTEAMRQVIRPTDLAARLGGDEMAVLLSASNATGAAKVAARLRRAVAELNPLRTHSLTLSIGIADGHVLPSGPLAVWQARDSLFRAADEALYIAKQRGRDQYVCHDSCFAVDEINDADVTCPLDLAL